MKIYTPKEAAVIISKSVDYVYKNIKNGNLQAVKLGSKIYRIQDCMLESFMDKERGYKQYLH